MIWKSCLFCKLFVITDDNVSSTASFPYTQIHSHKSKYINIKKKRKSKNLNLPTTVPV